ncbi:MAG: RNA degradosome polyphosphate kinase [Spirochaetaceae bacterium]|nr:RNA degradosome polyphosphate kinase [Spirochaetaceae bacterium]
MSTAPWSDDAEPEPPRYADDTAEEIEDETVGKGQEQRDLPADRFLDRELSWLEFNARVLTLAEDGDLPLLERARFAAIFSRNLDEFFMVRVAGIKRRIAAGITKTNATGATPRERLTRVSDAARDLVTRHSRLFSDVLRPALAENDLTILRWQDLGEDEVARMRELFTERMEPVLTPLAVDPAHPFPYISGLSLNLAVVVCDEKTGAEHFARVKVPPLLPRLLAVDDSHSRLIPIEAVISAHLFELFPGMSVVESSTFRVTRNEDLEVDADVENLLHALERELSRRRSGAPVRLEVDDDTSERVLDLLTRELDITEGDVYRVPAPLDLSALWHLAELERPDLKSPGFVPNTHPALRGTEDSPADIFAAMRTTDILLHHPYDSFATSVQAFIEQAANDPDVHALKLTLYRTSGESPIVDALVDAARAGKEVLVVVEIKARFDEQANIRWARQLEQAGCHVVYGLVGLKTHCKLALVVRAESDGRLRRYVHVGTGNYNPKTARVYEDLGLLTADEHVGADVADLFNHLSGYTRHRDYETLLVAPDVLRPALIDLIAAEAGNAAAGRPSGISIKVNSLVDEAIVDALYEASRAGVEIDLLVRGMCSLRPGVPGLSETIRVRSLLGRFLEHSRIYRFVSGGTDEFWIGSADVMDRNLDRRVEALVRVSDDGARRSLDELLTLGWSSDVDHWSLEADATWTRTPRRPDVIDFQRELINRHRREA